MSNKEDWIGLGFIVIAVIGFVGAVLFPIVLLAAGLKYLFGG